MLIISADSHAEEPEELYQRLPREYRPPAPHIILKNGRRYLYVEGQQDMPLDAPNPLNQEDMRRFFRETTQEGELPMSGPSNRGGGIDIPLRLADLEEDGVAAEVIYPQGIFKAFASPDTGYQRALTSLYNDWYHEIFGGLPDRFAVSALLPMVDISTAMDEARRAARKGCRSLSVPQAIPLLPYNNPAYEPFWATVEELQVPVAFHVFTYGTTGKAEIEYQPEGPGDNMAFTVTLMANAMSPLTLLIASGVLDRHPGLRFVLVEGGIGWLAWVLQLMDEMQIKRHMWADPKLPMKSSEYFKRQGYATFGDDAVGLTNRSVTGVDGLIWGSDYPHDEGTFPHSKEVIEHTFADVPDDETRKIVGRNAARLYHFPRDHGTR